MDYVYVPIPLHEYNYIKQTHTNKKETYWQIQNQSPNLKPFPEYYEKQSTA